MLSVPSSTTAMFVVLASSATGLSLAGAAGFSSGADQALGATRRMALASRTAKMCFMGDLLQPMAGMHAMKTGPSGPVVTIVKQQL